MIKDEEYRWRYTAHVVARQVEFTECWCQMRDGIWWECVPDGELKGLTSPTLNTCETKADAIKALLSRNINRKDKINRELKMCDKVIKACQHHLKHNWYYNNSKGAAYHRSDVVCSNLKLGQCAGHPMSVEEFAMGESVMIDNEFVKEDHE